jgi:hypothetical protein
MIPKIIHYCWFGSAPYSSTIKKCIESWATINPDYTIKFWNESNVPIHDFAFMKDAYSFGKYAFVSDYARYMILKQEGGFFLDTDVESLKKFDNLLNNQFICGFERNVKKDLFLVNPGLLLACQPEHPLIDKVLNFYDQVKLVDAKGEFDLRYTSPNVLTLLLKKEYGLNPNNQLQILNNGVCIYPSNYFSPINPRRIFNKFESLTDAYTIHYGEGSWINQNTIVRTKISIIIRLLLGDKLVDFVKNKFNFSSFHEL